MKNRFVVGMLIVGILLNVIAVCHLCYEAGRKAGLETVPEDAWTVDYPEELRDGDICRISIDSTRRIRTFYFDDICRKAMSKKSISRKSATISSGDTADWRRNRDLRLNDPMYLMDGIGPRTIPAKYPYPSEASDNGLSEASKTEPVSSAYVRTVVTYTEVEEDSTSYVYLPHVGFEGPVSDWPNIQPKKSKRK